MQSLAFKPLYFQVTIKVSIFVSNPVYEKILHSLSKKYSHFSREITNENRQFKPEMYVVQSYGKRHIFFLLFNFSIGPPIFDFSSTCCKLKDLELCYSQENFILNHVHLIDFFLSFLYFFMKLSASSANLFNKLWTKL